MMSVLQITMVVTISVSTLLVASSVNVKLVTNFILMAKNVKVKFTNIHNIHIFILLEPYEFFYKMFLTTGSC